MASIVDQELAVRAAILTVAPIGTYLKKVDSPGRLYEPVTAAQIVAEGGGGGAGSMVKDYFSWGDVSSSVIRSFQEDEIISSIQFIVLEKFDGVGAITTVGIEADPDLLVSVDDVDLSKVGTYIISPSYQVLADVDIKFFNTPGAGASTGRGMVIINF